MTTTQQVTTEQQSAPFYRDMSTMDPPWTAEQERASILEGWCLSECHGSENGPYQVMRLDDASDVEGAPQLDSDEEAWKLLIKAEKPHHVAALAFVKAHNPMEYEVIMEFAKKIGASASSSPAFEKEPRAMAGALLHSAQQHIGWQGTRPEAIHGQHQPAPGD